MIIIYENIYKSILYLTYLSSEFIDTVLVTFVDIVFTTFVDILFVAFIILSVTIAGVSAILFKYIQFSQILMLGFQL